MFELPKSQSVKLSTLMQQVNSGQAQLPEFQRSWKWEDMKIRHLLASISLGYPMGALMCIKYDKNMDLKYRPIEGLELSNSVAPEDLYLDGQQRLTAIYRAMSSEKAVDTKTEQKKDIQRFYYLDINKCLDEQTEREDAILSIPAPNKCIYDNFNRTVKLDLSSPEKEYENEMFPMNIIFGERGVETPVSKWYNGYRKHYNFDDKYLQRIDMFNEIIQRIDSYELPVIFLAKDTPKEAICKIFEYVNTGGVPLTVFELVTASFASGNFNLREDWETCKAQLIERSDILDDIDETSFLTAITLYSSYQNKNESNPVSCKKKDVLKLTRENYEENREAILAGFDMARKFLNEQYIFFKKDLPYTTQILPLAAICATIGKNQFNKAKTKKILSRWFWCGVMGEMYGSMTDTRIANDIVDVIDEIEGRESSKRTIKDAYFHATRLLSLKTKNSAAYKGLMALILKNQSLDFMSGLPTNHQRSIDEKIDIHHIFPKKYCNENDIVQDQCDSIINKTPLSATSNQQIGGDSPQKYSQKIIETGIELVELQRRVESNGIDFEPFFKNDFKAFFEARTKFLLKLIEKAMEKEPIND